MMISVLPEEAAYTVNRGTEAITIEKGTDIHK
jgi:hypothetical protein